MKNLKILAPVDFSELSEKGLRAANQIAKIFNGTITPFHSYIPLTDMDGFHYMGSGFTSQESLTDIEKVISQRLTDIANDNVDSEYLEEGVIGIGNPAHAIAETAADYDMIVMSTHGRTGFSRFILGSVAEKVLRIAHKPVMIVENDKSLSTMNRILVTTDFSDNAKAAFPYALEFAKQTGAELDLFHAVIHDPYDTVSKTESTYKIRKENMEALAEKHFGELKGKVNIKLVTSDKSAHEAILKQTEKVAYNLVVISTIGRTGLDYLMLGSTASNVVRTVKSAVLSINTEKQIQEKIKALKA